jgi:hypothetical protein
VCPAESGRARPQEKPTGLEVLRLIDACFAEVGAWPSSPSGPIAGAPGETWEAIDHGL